MEILGIDIGGSGLKASVVDTQTGELLDERQRIATPQPAKPKSIAKAVAKLVKHYHWQGMIGCGFPAVVQHGIIRTASNIDESWIGINAVQLLQQTTGCKTTILNDADAAGIAEMKFGAGKGNSGVVVIITVGTGIGSAFFIEGKLLPNTEFGQFYLNGKIAEKYAADIVRKELDLSWKKWGKRLDKYLKHLEMLVWPDLIIVGGGLSKKFEKISKYLTIESRIVPAQLLNDAGIVGASLAAEKSFFPSPD
jgi:polyphosphate glucokinase